MYNASCALEWGEPRQTTHACLRSSHAVSSSDISCRHISSRSTKPSPSPAIATLHLVENAQEVGARQICMSVSLHLSEEKFQNATCTHKETPGLQVAVCPRDGSPEVECYCAASR